MTRHNTSSSTTPQSSILSTMSKSGWSTRHISVADTIKIVSDGPWHTISLSEQTAQLSRPGLFLVVPCTPEIIILTCDQLLSCLRVISRSKSQRKDKRKHYSTCSSIFGEGGQNYPSKILLVTKKLRLTRAPGKTSRRFSKE